MLNRVDVGDHAVVEALVVGARRGDARDGAQHGDRRENACAAPGLHAAAPYASRPLQASSADSVHQAVGCLVPQPFTASSSAASEISSGSLSAGPINCTPIGNPSDVKPAGTLIDGQPSRFHGHVAGQARIMARSVDRPLRLSKWCTAGGGSAVVGARITSTRLKMYPTRRRVAASLARALRSTFSDSSRPILRLPMVRGSSMTS